jgi:hypothetical protein
MIRTIVPDSIDGMTSRGKVQKDLYNHGGRYGDVSRKYLESNDKASCA